MITVTDGKAFKIGKGSLAFMTSGSGTISLAVTLKDGSVTSTITIEAPSPYFGDMPECSIVPTLNGASLEVDYIRQY